MTGSERMPSDEHIANKIKVLSGNSQHIKMMLATLYAALEEGRPWSLVRLGDGEYHSLRGVHAPWAYCDNRCATHTDAGDLRQHSLKAIGEADWVGWHQDQGLTEVMELARLLPPGWMKWRMGIIALNRQPTVEEIVECFGALPVLICRSQYAWCNLHMGIRRGFVERVLRPQKLFLAGEPMERWLRQVLHPAGLGEGATVWSGDTTVATMGQAMSIVDAFIKSDATVMLASLGVWALPVVGRAKALGKIAIDWGHTPDHNLKASCEAHQERWGKPVGPDGRCPRHPACQAHWRYKLNTCCEDSPKGTMEHYAHAGTAGQCLPE